MNKNNVFGVGMLIIILTIIGGLLVKVFVLDKNKVDDVVDDNIVKIEQKNVSIEQDGYQFDAKYKEENTWEYTISGTKPSPCHEIKHEVFVRESLPEQVTVNLSVLSPEPDTNCIQVIEEFTERGTFSASSEATVSFVVSNQ